MLKCKNSQIPKFLHFWTPKSSNRRVFTRSNVEILERRNVQAFKTLNVQILEH